MQFFQIPRSSRHKFARTTIYSYFWKLFSDMKTIDCILCSGSGNRFLLIDALRTDLSGLNIAAFAAREPNARKVDGLLLLARDARGRLAMRMFNTDGSEAEMCGNGIRCVARLACEHHPEAAAPQFDIVSGGRAYRITREEPIFGTQPTFGVEIPLSLHGGDFPPSLAAEGFVQRRIPLLDRELAFTFLSTGNPHLVGAVEARSAWLFGADGRLDTRRLAALGERANRLRDLFPKGINVSIFCRLERGRIFAATYERGVGITSSCGTAMTSCATAAALSGLCAFESTVEVWNRGGRVRCRPHRTPQGLVTRLTGNALFEAAGTLRLDAQSRVVGSDFAPCDSLDDELRLHEAASRELNDKYGLTTDDHD